MSRFRKIEARMWSDDRFRALSPMQPSGQGLWVFLLTGPHTGPVPGLFRAGRAGMAEELGWEIEEFNAAFQEIEGQGMAVADFKARLMWLPNGLKHNKPESPNVVRSWRAELDLLPECDLKRQALKGLRAKLADYGAPYVEAFDEVVPSRYADICGDPTANPSRKGSSKAPEGIGEGIPEGIPEGMPESGAGAGAGAGIDDDDPGASAHADTREGVGAHAEGGAPAAAPVADEPQWKGDPYDNPSTATKRGQWLRWFDGVGHRLDSTCDRTREALDRWVRDKVTIGEVLRALDRAKERSAEPIGDLLAYVDSVITDRRTAAALAAAKPPVEHAQRGGQQHQQGAAVPTYEESRRAAAADDATKPDKQTLANRAKKAREEAARIAAAKVASPPPAPTTPEGASA